ncbi:MAG: hypothetical protein EPN47_16055 [Acidobacteria bacterium]|nr:MAG: hypothetical protein EPN47_16055 [Acidobacteriota bacterium]
MSENKISRRQFIESSIGAASLAWPKALPAAAHSASSQIPNSLTIEATGDPQHGYCTSILSHGRRVSRCQGEFSAVFQNGDRSLEDRVKNWKASSWSGSSTHLHLRGEAKLPNLNTTVFVSVQYEVTGPQIVRKRIRFRQLDMYMLFYQVSHRMEPEEPPAKFWSFDQADCQGGALHELFPAVGFRTREGTTVGLLTDSGFRNHWSRLIRRDGRPVKPAPKRIPDVNLNYVPRLGVRAMGELFVEQTYGEALVWPDVKAGEAVNLPPAGAWQQRGQVMIEERNGAVIFTPRTSEDGVIIPFPAHDNEVYSISVRYRTRHPFAIELWDVDAQSHMIENFTLYNDRVPESPEEWSEFTTTVFCYSLRGQGGALFISVPPSEQAIHLKSASASSPIELRGLELRRLNTYFEPYHRLAMDRPEEKRSFIFVDTQTPDTLRGYRLASELHLADALGFQGGETEKILFADTTMLSWMAGPEYLHPMVAPSIWYSAAGETYLRDSFYAANGMNDRTLNEGVFNLWGANQGLDGAINTLVEPNKANLERKSNDSTPLWLIWALQNRRRFGIPPPMEKIRKAAEYCLKTYDKNHNGLCWAQFVVGQLDVFDFPQGATDICENQGMLAVMLRTVKDLEVPGISSRVSDSYLEKVEENYRSYYDPVRKHLRPTRHVTDAIGFDEIFPEFLSLWLFRRKILTDEMMCNHLDRIPVLLARPDAPYPEEGGTARPIFIGLPEDRRGWSYFSDTWHPMINQDHADNYASHQMDGIYYNGGSWMREEICGYTAGKLHGWHRADRAIANRLWAEINISPDFPTSQEYLATNPAHPFFGHHRVFAWNVFVLQALELAGLRQLGT